MLTSKQVRGLILDYWWILALVLVLVFLAWLFFGDGRNNRNETLESDISGQKGVNAVITNQIEVQQIEVNNAVNNSKEAEVNFNRSLNQDSSSFTGNATERFCARFPKDSTCRK